MTSPAPPSGRPVPPSSPDPLRPSAVGRRRWRRFRYLPGLLAVALVAAACGGGPGSREDLIDVLTLDEAFSVEEATCMADAVFDRYGDDDDALGKISAADSFDFFDGENGIPGFSEFFNQTVQSCATVGPTSG
ncbi:MAG: hypothetical protein AAF531_01150 [Actinomycetota bacterium]